MSLNELNKTYMYQPVCQSNKTYIAIHVRLSRTRRQGRGHGRLVSEGNSEQRVAYHELRAIAGIW